MAADCRIIAIFASKYWALFGMDIAKAFEVAFNRKIEKNCVSQKRESISTMPTRIPK